MSSKQDSSVIVFELERYHSAGKRDRERKRGSIGLKKEKITRKTWQTVPENNALSIQVVCNVIALLYTVLYKIR